jgi:hypothetical protein
VFLVLCPVIARQRLGGATGWGLIDAGLGVGALAGGLIVLKVKPHRPLVVGNLALVLGALPLLALAAALPLYAVIAFTAIGFAGSTFLNGVWRTAVQNLIPARALSRVSSYDILVSYAVLPVGYALAGPASAAGGTGKILIIASMLMAVPPVLIVLVPGVRAVVRMPDGSITGPPPRYWPHRRVRASAEGR